MPTQPNDGADFAEQDEPFDAGADVTEGDDAKKLIKAKPRVAQTPTPSAATPADAASTDGSGTPIPTAPDSTDNTDRAAADGGVKQADGSVAFSDMPGKPGYNANLTGIQRNLSGSAAPGAAGPIASAVAAAGPISPDNDFSNVQGGSTTTSPNMPAIDPTLPRSPQSAYLANRGLSVSQQTDTAIGGDGTGDDATARRRAAIQSGTAPGQSVRLGYDSSSQIYGTSSRPGGPIDTFLGAGVPDQNNPTTQIDGASAVAANNVGLGDAAAGGMRSRNLTGSMLPGAAGATTQPGPPQSFADRATADGGVSQEDGSYAFSNMPGKAGYNPAPDNLGDNTNVASARNLSNPVLGTNGYTPTSDQGVGSTAYRGLTNAINDARNDNQQTQRGALSDLSSISTGDPRSVSGTAARNAAIDLKSDLESAGRYAHGRGAVAQVQQAAINRYMSGMGAAPGMLSEGMRNEAGTNDNAVRGLTSLGTGLLNNDARVNSAEARADAALRGAGLRADATRDVASTNAGAKVDAAKIDADRLRTNPAFEHGSAMAYANAYKQAIANNASEDDAIAAGQKSRAAFDQRSGQQQPPPPPRIPQIPPSAPPQQDNPTPQKPSLFDIEYLKSNPSMRQQFEKRFGNGSAAQILGK
jgi:hypothetical protein